MPEFFDTPFPFANIVSGLKSQTKLNLDESIRTHLRSLVLMRIGEFSYDRSMGFEIWDYDKQVFYHEKSPYYESKETQRGLLERSTGARKHFKENLHQLIASEEIRLKDIDVQFNFKKVHDNLSVYQRKIVIKVDGKYVSTGEAFSPSFEMNIMYTPFHVKTNSNQQG